MDTIWAEYRSPYFKSNYKENLPILRIKYEGRGKRTQTVLENLEKIADALKRKPICKL